MNLDDFIFPSSVASPAGLSDSMSSEHLTSSANATAPAIAIQKQGYLGEYDLHPPRASASLVPPDVRRVNEFGYVQRRVRKTSIDERRVSHRWMIDFDCLVQLTHDSLPRGGQMHLLRPRQ